MAGMISDIAVLAAKVSATSLPALRGASRDRRTVSIRHAVFLIAWEHGFSTPQIGRAMGRDHSSVQHGIRRAKEIAERDTSFADLLAVLRKETPVGNPYLAGWQGPIPFRETPVEAAPVQRRPMFDTAPEPDDGMIPFNKMIREGSMALRDAIMAERA